MYVCQLVTSRAGNDPAQRRNDGGSDRLIGQPVVHAVCEERHRYLYLADAYVVRVGLSLHDAQREGRGRVRDRCRQTNTGVITHIEDMVATVYYGMYTVYIVV